jgi:hypothetical protein
MLSKYKRTSWSYPALRAWAKHNKMPDHRIDTLIIGARKDQAPQWSVEKRNGRWASLSTDTPVEIEYFFKNNCCGMLDQARRSVPQL